MNGDSTAKRRRTEPGAPEQESRTYTAQRILGKGSFGVVYQASVLETGEIVAIKSIRMQDKDREIQILKELRDHPNVVALNGAFMSDENSNEPKLNMVLEFLSDTLHRVIKHYNAQHKTMEQSYVKLYLYQLLRGLAFVHGRGIVHCDIKPQNLLLEGKTHKLKLCDFGTARRMDLKKDDPANRPYVCSRYYRAPELILGSVTYTTSIDLWSSGCVFGEMILGQPLFTGKDGINQLVEIIKVLGTPSVQELRAMNPNYPEYDFQPKVEPLAWETVFKGETPREANELAGLLLRFDPASRLPPLQALMHWNFDQLRGDRRSGHLFLFDFREDEVWWCTPRDRSKLIPDWFTQQQAAAAAAAEAAAAEAAAGGPEQAHTPAAGAALAQS